MGWTESFVTRYVLKTEVMYSKGEFLLCGNEIVVLSCQHCKNFGLGGLFSGFWYWFPGEVIVFVCVWEEEFCYLRKLSRGGKKGA